TTTKWERAGWWPWEWLPVGVAGDSTGWAAQSGTMTQSGGPGSPLGGTTMKLKTQRRSVYGMVTAAALSLLLVAPALAQSVSTATVTGGDLTMTTPAAGNFTANITGVDQTVNTTLAAFSVSDLTGSGAGWNV